MLGKSEKFGQMPRTSALNLCRCAWQSLAWAALICAIPAIAAPTTTINTLPHGRYTCELAGNALGDAGIHQADQDFTVTHSSTYMVGDETGTYLLTGNHLTLTSGPKQGETYRRISENFLRKLAPDGSESRLRCIRGG
jgi:hypothetical protein